MQELSIFMARSSMNIGLAKVAGMRGSFPREDDFVSHLQQLIRNCQDYTNKMIQDYDKREKRNARRRELYRLSHR